MKLSDWVIAEEKKLGSLNAVYKATGINNTTLREFKNGDLIVKPVTIERLAKYIGKPEREIIQEFSLKDFAAEQAKNSPNKKTVETFENITWIPVYDIMASAGNGIMNYPVICQTGFDAQEIASKFGNNHRLEGIKVRGDSMQPTVDDGDIVYINRDDTTAKNGIFVIRIADEILVKRITKLPSRFLKISSDNELYPSFEVDLSIQNLDFEIIGRVWKKLQDVS
jgi:phage repressor protein C with HTH and peptisase S24 domain